MNERFGRCPFALRTAAFKSTHTHFTRRPHLAVWRGLPYFSVLCLAINLCCAYRADFQEIQLSPQASGTIQLFPEFGILRSASLVGTDVQSTYFKTTPSNREFRRGFLEFAIPAFEGQVLRATLTLREARGMVTAPVPPDLHEFSTYPADGVVNTNDFDRPTTFVASFETDANVTPETFSFDVTSLIDRFRGSSLGFRIKLAVDPTFAATGSFGSAFDGILRIEAEVSPPFLAIERQPQSQTVLCERDVLFAVTASGSAPMHFQWRFNELDIPGATNPILHVPNPRLADAGNLSVQISNAAGTVLSTNAVLSVLEPNPAMLSITREGSIAELSWPVTCTRYTLDETESLNATSPWTASTGPVTILNGRHRVRVALTQESRFFRLRGELADFQADFVVGTSLGFPVPLEHGVTVDTSGLPEPFRNIPLSFALNRGSYRMNFWRTQFRDLFAWQIVEYNMHSDPVTFSNLVLGSASFYLDPGQSSVGAMNISTGQGRGIQHLLMSSEFLGAMGFGLVPVEIHTHAAFSFPSNGIMCVANSQCTATVPGEVPILGGAPLLAHGAGCSRQAAPKPPSKPSLKIKREGETDYEYPDGPNGEKVRVRLGRTGPVILGDEVLWGFAFEVSFPAGTEECRNHMHQYIKRTGTFADGTQLRNPPAKGDDLGGFDSKNWSPDPRPDGVNPDTQSNPDGAMSYRDLPGFIIPSANRDKLPATVKAKFRWVLHDCDDRQLDCKEAEYALEVNASGAITKAELTEPKACE